MTYEMQKEHFLKVISSLNEYRVDDNMKMVVPQWDEKTGVIGFPNKISVDIEYTDIGSSGMSLNLLLNKCGEWKIEILSLDICHRCQRKGLGRRLIEHTKSIAKMIGAKTIYGDVFEREGYSSAGFYEKCGFEIKGDDTHRVFRMEVTC